jgi:S-formylglutathione hydrolase FrmB
MFSAAIGVGDISQAAYPQIYNDMDAKLAKYFAAKPALLWIAIGSTDFLYNANTEFRAKLDAASYPYEYLETEGGHIWRNWRIYLTEFLPKLFK